MSRRFIVMLALLALSGVFCNFTTAGTPSAQPTPDVDAMVNATLTAIAEQNPTETPAPSIGSISGGLGYPADAMPPVRVVAYLLDTDRFFYVETQPGQMDYRLDDLPVGRYHVLAYTVGGNGFPAGLSGGFTQAVICGLNVSCTDHSLVNVIVEGGQETLNVNVRDWLQPDFPPDPLAATGSITGTLIFPSEVIPAQRIVATNISSNQYYYVDTIDGESTYAILNLPVGTYHVVAYVLSEPSFAAGYSAYVTCGLSSGCADHSLLDVIVMAGQQIEGVNPQDWYAPPGSFPADPSRP